MCVFFCWSIAFFSLSKCDYVITSMCFGYFFLLFVAVLGKWCGLSVLQCDEKREKSILFFVVRKKTLFFVCFHFISFAPLCIDRKYCVHAVFYSHIFAFANCSCRVCVCVCVFFIS